MMKNFFRTELGISYLLRCVLNRCLERKGERTKPVFHHPPTEEGIKRRVRIKPAFTLAEVLITLGIIGIVAAMTLPMLIEKYQKIVVVTRLKKFYTNINQAIRLSEAENGSYEYWDFPEDNNVESTKIFYDKYLAKYLKTIGTDSYSSYSTNNDGSLSTTLYNYLVIKFADGSAMILRPASGLDISFYIYASKVNSSSVNGVRDCFSFSFNKSGSVGITSFVEPYTYQWDGTREGLFSHNRYGCSDSSTYKCFCAKLIQYDGWEIKDDYPW